MTADTFSLLAAARQAPERIAVVRSGEALPYRRLLGDVRRAASRIGADGSAGPVGWVATPSYERFVTLHAAIALGLPAALFHPGWPARLRAEMSAQCGARMLAEPATETPERRFTIGPPPPDDRRPLAMIATSGTGGGQPRWAVLSRAALALGAAMSAQNLGWQDDDRWLLSLSTAHVGGLSIVLRALAARRTVVLARLDWSRPAGVLEVIRRDRATLLSVVPTQLERLLTVPGRAPSSVRAMLVGGAAASSDLLDRSRERGWPVLATYGSTEAGSQIATQRRRAPAPCGSCGPPLAGLELRIDPDDVIAVRGPSLMTGYLPLSGPQPFADGWLRTGDRGRLDADGNLFVLGRADDVILSGGENVDPLAVEAALTAHPAIAGALVFGVSDATWGQAVAALLVADDQRVDDAALARHVSGRLASFARPRRIAWCDALPETRLGKPDRRAAEGLADRLRTLGPPGPPTR